ncbi:extracellular solute-binding protein [Enterovibrio makurazakiensis]|uniref:Putrescine-binding periplasmic protein n=1 Tax=Enterovibrio gelatinilyticus TaxID=2899819 RepID=A0ABT5QUB0_9GAMM|nr:extracellular solute-binding protein [Enterovibrio sp. ZSDZ42]MDD1791586.1 extracellular solute-binding protein [Enterovibrio sp. ZSDZ42]
MKLWSKFVLGSSLAFSLFSHAAVSAENELYFYNWSEYIPTEVLEEFTEETGIKVIYSTYESNESMYAKLKTHPEGYDLVVPSTYYVKKMRDEGMLQPIDKSKLSHFAGLDPNNLNKPFDPNNDYSIPYIWGATGIGVNTDVLEKDSVSSWADLWSPDYEGQLLMMDDAREFFHIALTKLGYSANTTNPEEIKQAYEELKKIMPNVLVFNSDFPANPYMAGEVALGMLWNGSAYIARSEGAPVDIVWPEEGAIFWMDNLAIPATAKNADSAHQMINFLLRPEIAARLAIEIGYPTPVKAAYPLLPKAFKDDPSVYPPQEVMEKGEWQSSVGEANVLYEEYFQKLKAGQ